jgi:hypothetical protein
VGILTGAIKPPGRVINAKEEGGLRGAREMGKITIGLTGDAGVARLPAERFPTIP